MGAIEPLDDMNAEPGVDNMTISKVMQIPHSISYICSCNLIHVTLHICSYVDIQGGEDPQDALSLEVIFQRRAL